MSVKIRMSRGGTKKKAYYRIVAIHSQDQRDGRYIERLGTYDPRLPNEHEKRLVLNEERIKYWLSVGAQPSDRVARFLDKAGLRKRDARNNPQKMQPKTKAQERAKAAAAAAAAGGEAAAPAS
jgi:small subunit ribosomal protein S16